jgi:hypothetical protein
VTSGRYHRGPVEFPEGPTWPALYLALRPEIPWVEITRHGPVLPQHNEFLLSELSVALPGVVDCRDVMAMGLSAGDLLHDTDYGVPHGLAAAALVGGAKGMIVPSATLLGDNLIILPENLPLPGDYELLVVHSREMRAYVERAEYRKATSGVRAGHPVFPSLVESGSELKTPSVRMSPRP